MQNPVNRVPYSYHGEYSATVTMVNTARTHVGALEAFGALRFWGVARPARPPARVDGSSAGAA